MKKVYVGVCLVLAIIATNAQAATTLEKGKEKEKTEVANTSKLTIHGYGNIGNIQVSPMNMQTDVVTVSATAGFEVTPTSFAAGSDGKVEVKLTSTKARTTGKIIFRSGDMRYTVDVEGINDALPVKELSKSPVYTKGGEGKFKNTDFNPSEKKGYTVEFKVKIAEDGNEFYPYAVDKSGNGFRAYITSAGIGLFHAADKGGSLTNPATGKEEGGKGIFYNNDGATHVYRFAVTPDNHAFIYRDGLPVDTLRLQDFGKQADWATGNGEMKENLLVNPNFEGEYENFDVKDANTVVKTLAGWQVSIQDYWCSQSFVAREEIDNQQDFNNHILRVTPYKWNNNWGGSDINQIVDVVPGETYTLTALAKGGIRKQGGSLAGSICIEEVQDREKKAVIQVASDSWETYSTDFTTSANCKQIRVAFRNEAGRHSEDRSPLEFDNVKLTGKARIYSPQIGFDNQQAVVEYFTYDMSGAYAPAQPTLHIEIK